MPLDFYVAASRLGVHVAPIVRAIVVRIRIVARRCADCHAAYDAGDDCRCDPPRGVSGLWRRCYCNAECRGCGESDDCFTHKKTSTLSASLRPGMTWTNWRRQRTFRG